MTVLLSVDVDSYPQNEVFNCRHKEVSVILVNDNLGTTCTSRLSKTN